MEDDFEEEADFARIQEESKKAQELARRESEKRTELLKERGLIRAEGAFVGSELLQSSHQVGLLVSWWDFFECLREYNDETAGKERDRCKVPESVQDAAYQTVLLPYSSRDAGLEFVGMSKEELNSNWLGYGEKKSELWVSMGSSGSNRRVGDVVLDSEDRAARPIAMHIMSEAKYADLRSVVVNLLIIERLSFKYFRSTARPYFRVLGSEIDDRVLTTRSSGEFGDGEVFLSYLREIHAQLQKELFLTSGGRAPKSFLKALREQDNEDDEDIELVDDPKDPPKPNNVHTIHDSEDEDEKSKDSRKQPQTIPVPPPSYTYSSSSLAPKPRKDSKSPKRPRPPRPKPPSSTKSKSSSRSKRQSTRSSAENSPKRIEEQEEEQDEEVVVILSSGDDDSDVELFSAAIPGQSISRSPSAVGEAGRQHLRPPSSASSSTSSKRRRKGKGGSKSKPKPPLISGLKNVVSQNPELYTHPFARLISASAPGSIPPPPALPQYAPPTSSSSTNFAAVYSTQEPVHSKPPVSRAGTKRKLPHPPIPAAKRPAPT